MNRTKRCFDVAVASVLFVLLIPVFAVIIVAMKLTSPGPLIFRQQRIGRGGKIFSINKFRKFPANWGTAGPSVTLQADSRMTTIGRFLERTKLDELPQLWNIILGEMSFVGPRPESLAFSQRIEKEHSEVLRYTPGLFGPNQAKYRNESAMYPPGEDPVEYYEQVLLPDKANTDIEYFRNATFFSDLGWMIRGGCALVFSLVLSKRTLLPVAVLMLWDLVAIASAWVATHWLKYSVIKQLGYSAQVTSLFTAGMVVLPLVMIAVFAVSRVYRNPIRYFSETDAFRLFGAACAVWIVSAVIFGVWHNSVSSLLLSVSALVSVCLMALPRVGYRLWHQLMQERQFGIIKDQKLNIIVCGVSPQSIAISNLLRDGFNYARVIGMAVGTRHMVGREIHGFKVLGTYADLDVLHKRYNVDQVWYGSNIDDDSKKAVNSWCISNEIEAVSMLNQPGFRRLISLQPGDHAPVGIGAGSAKETSRPEVAA